MNHIYIGDRQLEPDDEIECDWCSNHMIMFDADDNEVQCPYCQSDSDPSDPNEHPE